MPLVPNVADEVNKTFVNKGRPLTPTTPAGTVPHDGPPALGGEKGSRCRERSPFRSCPRNCKRRALASATGKPGRRERLRPASQETCHRTLCFGGVWAGCTGRDLNASPSCGRNHPP